MKLIALTGLHGAGKDTVADALPARKLAFADVLYREVAEAFGVTVAELKCRETKESVTRKLSLDWCGLEDFVTWHFKNESKCYETEEEWIFARHSPRQILQWWGDYRRAQDPGYFVDSAFADVCTAMKVVGESVVLTDVRFPNEAAMVRQLGGQIWQIKRPGYEAGGTGHASDTAGDEFAPDRVVTNGGSLEDLRATVLAAWGGV